MFGLLLRKTIYDLWDNLLAIFLMNLGYLLLAFLIYGIGAGLFALAPLLFPFASVFIFLGTLALVFILAGCLFSLYTSVVASFVTDIANGGRAEIAKIGQYLKENWLASLLFGFINGLAIVLIINSGFFYLPAGQNNFIYYFAFFLSLWGYLLWLIASQYFYALQSRFDKKLRKNIRKMFILLFDNTAFTILALTPFALLFLAVSLFTMLLIPGLAGLQLFYAVALKLRIYKYDYLEANPQANRKEIPWETILAEERERTGKRTIRSFIFPWKD